MTTSTSFPYRTATRLGSLLLPLASSVSAKFREGHVGRRGALERLRLWGERHREQARPLVWFHASSVGEGLQAESVLLELRDALPEAQYVYTHFSPSAAALARRLPVDAADYLPYDRPEEVGPLLGAIRPSLLVFAKLDLWPELATGAAKSGGTVAMVAATVSPGSGRLAWPARQLLRAGYQSVAAAGAVSAEDARRLARLGVAQARIQVLGDPRYDSVMAKVRAVGSDDAVRRLGLSGAPTLIAGSTWPLDEAVVLRAYARLRSSHPEARLILVPHEPTDKHLASVERRAAQAGLIPVRLAAATGPEPFLMVDQVGLLAALYGVGTMAYVGGGFGGAGLHSVLEPAAWGLPVVFGPNWRESRDASVLLEANAAQALASDGTRAEEDLLRCWTAWIDDPALRRAQGKNALAAVTAGLGAARRSAEMLARLVR